MADDALTRGNISIVDVAQLAGVSKSTVSRVINQVPGVNVEVARNVQNAMEQLGYQPSARRRGPKTAARRGIRTGNILFLVLGSNVAELNRMPVFPALLHGVEAAVRDAGLFLVLAAYHPDESLPAALGSNQVDGVLLFQPGAGPETPPPAIKSRFEKLPSVGLMRGFEEPWPHIDRVLYNNAAIGPMAARFLLNRGHTRIAFFNMERDHVAFTERQRSFVSAVQDAGATAIQLVCAQRREEITNESQELKGLIETLKSERATGLFASSDAQLPPLYAALERARIHPIKDIEIISCDNQPGFLSSVSPRPATIDINLEMVGRVGVQWLLWRLANLEQENRVTVLVEPFIVPST